MKKLLLGLFLVSSFAASAQTIERSSQNFVIIKCYQDSPNAFIEYDSKKSTYKYHSYYDNKTVLHKGVIWEDVYESPPRSVLKKGDKILLTLYKEGSEENNDPYYDDSYDDSYYDDSQDDSYYDDSQDDIPDYTALDSNKRTLPCFEEKIQ